MESQALLSLSNTMMEKWWKQSEKQNISLKKAILIYLFMSRKFKVIESWKSFNLTMQEK